MEENIRVSLAQIARRVGVSKMTVSRALRGHGGLTEALRRKILAAARAAGYRLDPKVSALMGAFRHSRAADYRETVAFVAAQMNTWSRREFAGAEAAAKSLNYRVDLVEPRKEGMTGRDVSRVLRARGIRGVLLAPNSTARYQHYTLDWGTFATVLLGSSLANHRLPRVQLDHFAGCKLALRKLHHAGYRRIGLLLAGAMHERTNRHVLAAFLLWHAGGLRAAERLVHFYDDDLGETSFRKWLSSRQPDCLVADSDEWLEQITRRFGCRIPGQMGFVALATPNRRDVTGLQSSGRIGEEAMRLLDARLRARSFGLQDSPLTIMVPPGWQPGATAPPRRGG